jgi:pyruvate formate lyase activating enzyme
LTAFNKDYKMNDPDDTIPDDLLKAAEIGKKSGLRFIYAGNLPGRAGSRENTFCPACRQILIERRGFRVLAYRLTAQGNCPSCGQAIPGRWAESFRPQIAAHPYALIR